MDFLRGLQTLDLCSNKLKTIELKDLGNLELLYLRHNQLTRLPKLTSCINIKELQLGNNFIQVFFEFKTKTNILDSSTQFYPMFMLIYKAIYNTYYSI